MSCLQVSQLLKYARRIQTYKAVVRLLDTSAFEYTMALQPTRTESQIMLKV